MWRSFAIGLILSFINMVCLANSPPSRLATNATCSFIASSLFEIDLNCIAKQKKLSSVQNFTTTNAQFCTSNHLCQFDIFHWEAKSQSCIAISADVLKSCPLVADGGEDTSRFQLFFAVSKKMPQVVVQALVAKGYKYKIAELLECNLHKYLCDDLTCIDRKYHCDGIFQCQDQSDEITCPGQQKCLGRDGKFYSIGEEYAPHTESDVCKICICGAGASAAYCYSPRCSARLTDCSGSSPNLCCKCSDDSYLKKSTSILGYSQRLLVSCLSVLFLISLLLILSRGFTQQIFRRHDNQHTTQSNWISMTPRELPPNRSFFETNSVRPCATDFFDREADVPPPYFLTKLAANEEENDLPPSYEDSAFHPEHPPNDAEDGVTSLQGAAQERTRLESVEAGPISPISTNSDCPLLRSDSERWN